jgi:hypothetical protein
MLIYRTIIIYGGYHTELCNTAVCFYELELSGSQKHETGCSICFFFVAFQINFYGTHCNAIATSQVVWRYNWINLAKILCDVESCRERDKSKSEKDYCSGQNIEKEETNIRQKEVIQTWQKTKTIDLSFFRGSLWSFLCRVLFVSFMYNGRFTHIVYRLMILWNKTRNVKTWENSYWKEKTTPKVKQWVSIRNNNKKQS